MLSTHDAFPRRSRPTPGLDQTALWPELVREPRPHRDSAPELDPRPFAGSYRVEEPGFWQRFDGYTDSPDRGEASQGQLYLDVAIAAWRCLRRALHPRMQPPR